MILLDTQKEEFKKLKEISVFEKDTDKEKLNGDLLVVGLGGAGGRVITALKGMLADRITPEDNINYLLVDSNIPEMEQTIEDSKDGLGLNALEVVSIYRPNLEKLLKDGIQKNPVHPGLAKWMKEDFPAISIGTEGAEGNRQIGRLMFSNAYEDMRILLFEKIEEVYEKSFARTKEGKLDVIIVSSVCGGTGSGILSDVTYNIKALAKSNKWNNFRIAGCLLMPDCFFGNPAIKGDEHKVKLLNANGCATLKEIDYFMRAANRGEGYLFESTTHRLSIKENIFDTCLLISGKKDKQGYIPDGTIYNDCAYFLKKLAGFKYTGEPDADGNRELLRELLFDKKGEGYFKVVNESDFMIPIRQIENLCEYEVFTEASKRMENIPPQLNLEEDFNTYFGQIKEFLEGQPGDEIKLEINGLLQMGSFEKPAYKLIKKGQDDMRGKLPRQLQRLSENIPVIIKSIKNKLTTDLESLISKYMRSYGPAITMKVIGAAGFGGRDRDAGLIEQIKSLEEKQKAYQPTNEYSRIVESILDIVKKRFFTLPKAKRETENGYYENCIKDALAQERNYIMDGLDSQDVFGDLIRLLRNRAERISDIYTQFAIDIKNAMEDLAADGKRVTGYTLKGAKQNRYLPTDYMTEDRINQMREGLINLMVSHENDIDAGRVVPVKQEMEKIYRNLLLGIGAYGPEKLMTVAFADKKMTLSETNMLFLGSENKDRDKIMQRAAESFVKGTNEKTMKKRLCVLKDDAKLEGTDNRKYISLPESMPYFSKAVKDVLAGPIYNEDYESITMNPGAMEISINDVFTGVPLSALACSDDMQKAYNEVKGGTYRGLHIDETMRDMTAYPDIM
ncbi:MAG: hypothetical protein IKO61_08965 [Lachnospiraceae bacterium]|nr:hypothetical protein [Lachnospiraceae bacterium]